MSGEAWQKKNLCVYIDIQSLHAHINDKIVGVYFLHNQNYKFVIIY